MNGKQMIIFWEGAVRSDKINNNNLTEFCSHFEQSCFIILTADLFASS